MCKGGKWHRVKFNLDAVNCPCKQKLAEQRSNMPSPFFLLETDYKIHPAGAETSDVTEFQVWMAAGGRGHLLISWWEKLMLRSQFQRPPSNSSFQPDAKACKGQLWKQAVRPLLPITFIANRGKEMGTSAWVSMARRQ